MKIENRCKVCVWYLMTLSRDIASLCVRQYTASIHKKPYWFESRRSHTKLLVFSDIISSPQSTHAWMKKPYTRTTQKPKPYHTTVAQRTDTQPNNLVCLLLKVRKHELSHHEFLFYE